MTPNERLLVAFACYAVFAGSLMVTLNYTLARMRAKRHEEDSE